MSIDLMCRHKHCSLRQLCYRFLATPKFDQIYLDKVPKTLDLRRELCYLEIRTKKEFESMESS
jgi:hypothetical protein